MKKFIIFILFVALLVVGLGRYMELRKITQNPDVSLVTTSFYPLYFFTSELIDSKFEVKNLTPAGLEPHDFEPSPQDVAQIEMSKAVILLGGGFEGWQNEATVDRNKVLLAGNGIFDSRVKDGESLDPHIWLSPRLAKQLVLNIGNFLGDKLPGSSLEGKKQSLLARLDELDNKYKTGLLECQRRDFVTAHAAFYYLAKEYNLNQISISGISPDQEPSLKQLGEITKLVDQKGIKHIFFETLVSPKLAETIAQETGSSTLVLDPIEGISQEDMKAGKNYFTIMEENLSNLRIALACK